MKNAVGLHLLLLSLPALIHSGTTCIHCQEDFSAITLRRGAGGGVTGPIPAPTNAPVVYSGLNEPFTGYRIDTDVGVINGNANFYGVNNQLRLQVFLPQPNINATSPGTYGQRAPLSAPVNGGVAPAAGACTGSLTGVYFLAERWGPVADFAELAVDFNLIDVAAGSTVGLVFSYRDPQQYYAVVQRNCSAEVCTGVYKVVGGAAVPLGSTSSASFNAAAGAVTNRLHVSRVGPAIQVWLNGDPTVVLSVTDSDPTPFAPGLVGIFGAGVQTCSFDNLAVTELPSCADGIWNGLEDGPDCGGPCAAPCPNPVVTTTVWNRTLAVPDTVGWQRETWGTASGTPSWSTAGPSLTQRTNTGLTFLGGPGGNSENWMGGAFLLCNKCGRSVDQEIEIDIYPIDNDWLGTVVRMTDRDNLYQFVTRTEVPSTAIHRRGGGANTVLYLSTTRPSYVLNAWLRLRMRVVGGRVTVWWNDVLWQDLIDPNPLLVAGYAGIFITNQDDSLWRRAIVRSWRPINALCSYPLYPLSGPGAAAVRLELDGSQLPAPVGAGPQVTSWQGGSAYGVSFYQSPYYLAAISVPYPITSARGYTGLNFDGGKYVFSLARYESDISAAGFTLVVVCAPSLTTSDGVVMQKGAARGLPGWTLAQPRNSGLQALSFSVVSGGADAYASISTTAVPSGATDSMLVVVVRASPSGLGDGVQHLWGSVNGVPFSNLTGDTSFSGTASLGASAYTYLGAHDDGTAGFRGAVFEVVSFAAGLSDADVAQLTGALQAKYALLAACPPLAPNHTLALNASACAGGAVRGARCTLSCAPGYAAVAGHAVLNCLGGRWDVPAPLVCERVCAPSNGTNVLGCTRQLFHDDFGGANGVPATPPPFSPLVFANVSSGARTPAYWETLPPRSLNWYVFNGTLYGDAPCGVAGATAYVSAPPWVAASVGAPTLRVTTSVLFDASATLYPRWVDANNNVALVLDAGANAMTLSVTQAGATTVLCGNATALATLAGQAYSLQVDMLPDGTYAVTRGGTLFCRAISSAFAAGGVAVGGPGGGNVQFGPLTVAVLDPLCAGGCVNVTAGKSCALGCAAGLAPVRGDAARTCLDGASGAGGWGGSPLVCGLPVPLFSNFSAAVPELSPAGLLVATANASMPPTLPLGGGGANATASGGGGSSASSPLLFEILSGNGAGGFSIEACSGTLRVAAPPALDYEQLTGARSFLLLIHVWVAGSSPVAENFAYAAISVLDANDPPQVSAPPGGCSVPEDSPPGAPVCALAVFDPDSLNSPSPFWPTTYAFTLSAAYGDAGTYLNISGAGAVGVRAAGISYITTRSFSLQVTATDAHDPASSGSSVVSVAVTHVNHPPVFGGPFAYELDQTAVVAGSVLAPPLLGTDPDAGDSLNFTSGPSPLLALSPDGTALQVAATRTYPPASFPPFVLDGRLVVDSAAVNVTVQDGSGLTSTGRVVLYVLANVSTGLPVVRALTVLPVDPASGAGTSVSPSGAPLSLLNTDGSDSIAFGCSGITVPPPGAPAAAAFRLSANASVGGGWVVNCTLAAAAAGAADGPATSVAVTSTVSCPSSPGFGTGWVLSLAYQSPPGTGPWAAVVPSVALSVAYAPPLVSSATPAGPMGTPGGTAVLLSGFNFGGPAAPVAAAYGPCSSAAGSVACDFHFPLAVAAGGGGHAALTLVSSPGLGAALQIQLTVGGQTVLVPPSVTLSYAPATVTALLRPDSNGSTLTLSAGGAQVVRLLGANFGPPDTPLALQPVVDYGPPRAPAGPGLPPPPFPFSMTCSYPVPASSHTLIECVTAPGVGTGLTLSVAAGGSAGPDTTVASGLLLGYAPPAITAVDGAAGRGMNTVGGQQLLLSVQNLGSGAWSSSSPAALFPAPAVTYGPPGDVGLYTASGCAVLPGTDPTGAGAVECTSAEGTGGVGGFLFEVGVAGQASAPWHSAIQYDAPLVTGFSDDPSASPGSEDASTLGGQAVLIQGRNFGPDMAGVLVYYSAQAAPGAPLLTFLPPVPCTKPALPPGSPPGTVNTAAHESIACTTSPGAGGRLTWFISVANQTSTQPTTSYAGPVVLALSSTPDGTGALGPASPQGGGVVYVLGSGFGPADSYAAPGGSGSLVSALSYGPAEAPYAPAAFAVLSDSVISLTLSPGVGAGHPVRVRVVDQASPPAPAAATLGFSPPVIAALSAQGGPTAGGTLIVATGSSWGFLDPGADFALTLAGDPVPIAERWPTLARVQAAAGGGAGVPPLSPAELDETQYSLSFRLPAYTGAGLLLQLTAFRTAAPAVRTSSDPAVDGPGVQITYPPPVLALVTVQRLTDPAAAAFLNRTAPGLLRTAGPGTRLLTVQCASAGPSASLAVLEVAAGGGGPGATWSPAPVTPVSWSDALVYALSTVDGGTLRMRVPGGPLAGGAPGAPDLLSNALNFTDTSPSVLALGGARTANFSTAGGDVVTLSVANLASAAEVEVWVGGRPADVLDGAGGVVPPSSVPATIVAPQLAGLPPGADAAVATVVLSVRIPPGQGSHAPIVVIRDGVAGSSVGVFAAYAPPALSSALVTGDGGADVAVFAPAAGGGPVAWPMVRVPAAGGAASLSGSNLGACPVVSFGAARGAACLADAAPGDVLVVLSANDTALQVQLPAGEGFGGGSWTLAVAVGDQRIAVPSGYRPPSVSAVVPVLPATGLPTAGNVTVVLEGRDFGRVAAAPPLVSVLLEGGGSAPLPCAVATRDPGAPDARIFCTLPEGAGANATVAVSVGDQTGVSPGVLRYDAPAIDGAWTLPAGYADGSNASEGNASAPPPAAFTGPPHGDTRGGYPVLLLGANLGAADPVHQCLFLSASRSAKRTCNGLADSYAEGEVPASAILTWGHGGVLFTMPPSPGGVLYISVQARLQANAGGATPGSDVWAFNPPTITAVTPSALQSDGGQAITITGRNLGFGPTGPTNAARLAGAAPLLPLPAPLPLPTDAGLPTASWLRVNFFSPQRCVSSAVLDEAGARPAVLAGCASEASAGGAAANGVTLHNDTTVVFYSLGGVGAAQNLSLTVLNPDGAAVGSNGFPVAFAAPVVDRVAPGQLALSAATQAGQAALLTVFGRNFGSGDTSAWSSQQLQVAIHIGDDAPPCSGAVRAVGAGSDAPTLQCTYGGNASAPSPTVGYKAVFALVAGQASLPPSATLFQVVCAPGSYAGLGETCLACPQGATCAGYDASLATAGTGGGLGAAWVNVTLGPNGSIPLAECAACYAPPVAQAGWFNLRGYTDPSGLAAAVCPPARLAAGGAPPPQCDALVVCEPAEACEAGNVCAAGYESRGWPYRCSQCAAGYYRTSGLCRACPAVPALTVVFFALAGIAAVAAGYLLSSRGLSFMYLTLGLDFFQVVATFASSPVGWPPAMLDAFRVLSAFNLNVELLALECSLPAVTYADKWGVVMALPLVVAAVLLGVHALVVAHTVLVRGQKLARAATHASPLISMCGVLMYTLYLYLARSTFDVFSCSPTVPPNFDAAGGEVTYLAGVFEPCGAPGGTQRTLLPAAVVTLLLYVIGWPAVVAAGLWTHRELIMEDQLLRAKGVGDDRLTNPHAYEFRRRYGRSYYQFRPDAFPWVLAIFLRKFLIALSGLVFAQNATFQMTAMLLVLFGAYSAQVRANPYMCAGDCEGVVARHAQLVREGSQLHARLEASLAGIEARGRKRGRAVNFSREGLSALRTLAARPGQAAALAGSWLYNANTLEATLLAAAMLVAIFGILFAAAAGEAPQADAFYASSRDAVLGCAIAVVSLASLYWLVVVLVDAHAVLAARRAARLARSRSGGAGKGTRAGGALPDEDPDVAALKSSNSRRLFVTPRGAASSSAAQAADFRPGPVESAFNPIFLNPDAGGASGPAITPGAIRDMELPPADPLAWRAVRDHYSAALDQAAALSAEVAGLKRALAQAGGGGGEGGRPGIGEGGRPGSGAQPGARREFGPVLLAGGPSSGLPGLLRGAAAASASRRGPGALL